MPYSGDEIDECACCATPRYFQHAESDCVMKTVDPVEIFDLLSNIEVDEIGKADYEDRIASGWSSDQS